MEISCETLRTEFEGVGECARCDAIERMLITASELIFFAGTDRTVSANAAHFNLVNAASQEAHRNPESNRVSIFITV